MEKFNIDLNRIASEIDALSDGTNNYLAEEIVNLDLKLDQLMKQFESIADKQVSLKNNLARGEEELETIEEYLAEEVRRHSLLEEKTSQLAV